MKVIIDLDNCPARWRKNTLGEPRDYCLIGVDYCNKDNCVLAREGKPLTAKLDLALALIDKVTKDQRDKEADECRK